MLGLNINNPTSCVVGPCGQDVANHGVLQDKYYWVSDQSEPAYAAQWHTWSIRYIQSIYISTNRPPMPHNSVGWSLGSFQRANWRNHGNVLSVIGFVSQEVNQSIYTIQWIKNICFKKVKKYLASGVEKFTFRREKVFLKGLDKNPDQGHRAIKDQIKEKK